MAKQGWSLEEEENFGRRQKEEKEGAEGGERERSRGKKGVAPSGLDLAETGL